MKFKVMNEKTATRKYEEDVDHVLIGVKTEKTYKVDYESNIKRLDSLLLVFADLDDNILSRKSQIISKRYQKSFIIFNDSLADKILNFYLKYKDVVELMIIHCEAGRSRSPGIAAALSIIDGGSDEFFFKCFDPNMKVYRTLLNRAVLGGLL